MSASLAALKKVAALDAKIMDRRRRSEEIPERLRQQEQAVEAARSRLAAKDAEYKDTRVKADLKAKDLDIAEQAVIKLRDQIGSAKSNKEFQTLQHEILSKEADNQRLEDAGLLQMQKVDRVNEDRVAIAEEVKQAEGALAQEQKTIEGELEALKTQLSELQSKRDGITGEVPDEILSKYERLIRRRGQTAMVGARNGSCQGCFMQLRPETIAQLKKGNELVFCHSCSRILYLDE
jgi:uncharacterized protein